MTRSDWERGWHSSRCSGQRFMESGLRTHISPFHGFSVGGSRRKGASRATEQSQMKGRHFMTLAGVGAIGTPALRSYPLSAARGSRWQPDGAGSLARIGVLTPDFDPVPESEMWAMAPQGVSIHASRVPWNREAKAFAEPPHVDSAAEQLAGLTPRVILYAFTSSSYVLGADADDRLRARLEKRARGIPVVL